MATNGKAAQIIIPVLSALVAVFAGLFARSALSDDDKKYVPRTEFQQVQRQIERIEQKVDENGKQQSSDYRELMREIQKRNEREHNG